MQTFLPYSNSIGSLTVLDNKRLGKQRVEAYQLLLALNYAPACEHYLATKGKMHSTTWSKHPAAKMWRGYEKALCIYYLGSLKIWNERGFKNTMPFFPYPAEVEWPHWWGVKSFHLSHQSNLLRKDFNHYSRWFDVSIPTDLPYIWPEGKP